MIYIYIYIYWWNDMTWYIYWYVKERSIYVLDSTLLLSMDSTTKTKNQKTLHHDNNECGNLFSEGNECENLTSIFLSCFYHD